MLDEVSNLFDEIPNDAYIRENFILGLASKSALDIPRKKYRKEQNIQNEEQKEQTATDKHQGPANSNLSQYLATLGHSRYSAAACQTIGRCCGMEGRRLERMA